MQELGKSSLKMNVVPNRLEKYISLSINIFQFLSSSLVGFIKNLSKYDFKYLRQNFDKILHFAKRKGLYPYMSNFGKFKKKKKMPVKEKFYSSLNSEKKVINNMNMF